MLVKISQRKQCDYGNKSKPKPGLSISIPQRMSLYIQVVPVMAQQKRIRLRTMRFQVRSLASPSELRIWCCRELWCRSQMRFRSHIAVAVA